MKDLSEYRVTGTNLVSFSRWSRENIPKPPHKIPLGAVVDIQRDLEESYLNFVEQDGKTITLGIEGVVRLIVVAHHHDCDGTALYEVASSPIASPTEINERIKWRSRVTLAMHGLCEDQLKPAGDIVPLETFVSSPYEM